MSYMVYGPVRVQGMKDPVIFVSSSYHMGCCMESCVMDASGEFHIVNPDTIKGIKSAQWCFDDDYYGWHRKRKPSAGWARYPALKAAYDAWDSLSSDEKSARRPHPDRVRDQKHDTLGRFLFAYTPPS